MNRRFIPRLNKAIALAGQCGPLRYVHAVMYRHNRTEDDFIWSTGIHTVDALCHIAGAVTGHRVEHMRDALSARWLWIDFTFAGGCRGRLEAMPTCGSVAENYHLFGDKYLEVPNEPDALVVNYYLKMDQPQTAHVTITNAAGQVVRQADGPAPVSCVPPSGSTFPLGDTIVDVTATDSAGNSSSAQFTATVQDTTAPSIGALPGPVAEATGPGGAIVNWTDPTANDLVDGSVTCVCVPVSGSSFPLGDTIVDVTATDAAGNTASSQFTVTVQDTTAPSLSGVPSDQVVEATGPDGAPAYWTDPTADDLVDGPVTPGFSVRIAGFANGTMILQRVFQLDAPSMRAASSSEGGADRNADRLGCCARLWARHWSADSRAWARLRAPPSTPASRPPKNAAVSRRDSGEQSPAPIQGSISSEVTSSGPARWLT